MVVANTHPILTGLLAQQQGTHQGATGGLGNPLDANERAILLKHVSQFNQSPSGSAVQLRRITSTRTTKWPSTFQRWLADLLLPSTTSRSSSK
jgi:hypothetical protein